VDLSVSKGDSLDHMGYSLLAMHQFRDSRSILVFVVLTIVGSTSLVGQAITENFRTIKIDPKTLVLKLEEPLPLVPSPNHNFYNLFRGNTISVVHLGPEGSHISYNAFDIDNDGSLLRRSKFQVLSEGPYGTVFAESTYFYGEQYKHQPTDFHVDLYFADGSHERSQEVQTFRAPGTLSAISRFVRQDIFNNGGLRKSHFLKYAVTAEDQQLDAIDSTIKFGR
jgi:hypothetical protein